MLPFATIDAGDGYEPVVLLGFTPEDGIIGLEFPSGDLWAVEPEDILNVISTEPAAVFWGVEAAWSSLVHGRAVANRTKKKLPKFVARGREFPLLPEGMISGFPVASTTLRKHRETIPSIDTIVVSAIFAVSTVRVRIDQAELSYTCFGELYLSRSRSMPPVQELRNCFQGLQNTKSAMFADVAAYAPTIHQAIKMGYRDRELRSVLALESEMPTGLGVAKLSFTLALLGHDTICLDGRLLGVLFPKKEERTKFEKLTKKEGGVLSDRSLLVYEAAEDAFLEGNKHYDPSDPLGRARAQWMAWEGVGKKGAEHGVWMNLLQEED